MRPERVEIVIGVRTLLTLLVFGLLVALAILSLGTLLSIFLATVLALGLDPVVARWSRAAGSAARPRWSCSPALFLSVFALVLVTAGPVWAQIVEFIHSLPAMWDELQESDWFEQLTCTAGADDKVREALKNLAPGCPTPPARCSASPAASSARS